MIFTTVYVSLLILGLLVLTHMLIAVGLRLIEPRQPPIIRKRSPQEIQDETERELRRITEAAITAMLIEARRSS
jgi:hypothetical protein